VFTTNNRDASAVDRYQILPKDENFVFDFNSAPFPMANRKTFPALVGTGISLAIAEIKGEPPNSHSP
jgi:hypothetical protein